MKLTEALADLQQVHPDQFPPGEPRRQLVLALDVVELLAAEVQRLGLLVEQQGDELRRLKQLPPRPPTALGTAGGRGRGLLAVVPEEATPKPKLSSERERKGARERQPKGSKLAGLPIHAEVPLVQFAAPLPTDAEFKGWAPYVCQDLLLVRHNTRFLRAKYHSPSTGKTYYADLPPGYHGHYGPGIPSLVLSLTHGCQVTVKPLHEWLTQTGVEIARSTVLRHLAGARELFAPEQREVYRAGLATAGWVATDTTETQMDGQVRACHVVGNAGFTVFCTLSGRDRRSVLSALQGGDPVQYRLDAAAYGELAFQRLSGAAGRALSGLSGDESWDAASFVRQLDRVLPERTDDQHKKILDAAALADYWQQARWPVVPLLLTDDAATYRGIAKQALCWIHELRHYKKLTACLACHREEREGVLTTAWEYYWELLAYQKAPSAAEAARLTARFDTIFGGTAEWGALSQRMALTHQKKTELLQVLAHPEVPLHNNGSELAARQRVRRRDISFQPRSEGGLAGWDVFQSLRETARKQGISFLAYLKDRITQAGEIPRLAEVIRRRASASRDAPDCAPG